jgi:hypothetical protein
MVTFDRTAAILSVLTSLDDRTTADVACISFATDNDHGVCHDLREILAREYRDGSAGRRDWYETAAIVATDVASRGDQFLRFAAVSDIATLHISTSPYDDVDLVIVDYGESLGDVVANALRFRFRQAAYQLVAYLEEHAAQQANHHHNSHVGDTESSDPAVEQLIY